MKLKKGKWYGCEKQLMLVMEDGVDWPEAIGFDHDGDWYTEFTVAFIDRKAKRKELEKVLSKEAIRRGFEGDFVFSKKENKLTWFCRVDTPDGDYHTFPYAIFDSGEWKSPEDFMNTHNEDVKEQAEGIQSMLDNCYRDVKYPVRVDNVNYRVDFDPSSNKATFSFEVYNAKNGVYTNGFLSDLTRDIKTFVESKFQNNENL